MSVDDGTSIESALLRAPSTADPESGTWDPVTIIMVDTHGKHATITEPLVELDPADASKWRLIPGANDKLVAFLADRFTGMQLDMPDRLLLLLLRTAYELGGDIEVVSGVRTKKHVPNSKHPLGRAIDFRLVGVPAEDVWSSCLQHDRVGCGLYRYEEPRRDFVHLDVRSAQGCWTWTNADVELPPCT